MAILLTGLSAGAYVYQKTYVNNVWRSLSTVVDNGAGDLDRRPGVVRLAGAANRTTFIQVDNNRRPGDEDTFYRATQNARGQLAGPLHRNRMAPLPVTQNAGMRRGAIISIYNADQTRLHVRAVDNSPTDLDRSGNIKFSTLVPWNQTFVVHIRNPGAASPIIRAFRNGRMVPVPPKPPSAAARMLANQIASQIKTHAGTIALYLRQSALRNDDTTIKENLKKGVASPGIQRAAALAADNLQSLQSRTFRATDGTVLTFNDVVRMAGEARTSWNLNKAKVARFRRLKDTANKEVTNRMAALINNLRDVKIDEIISDIPDAFKDMSNIGIQINTDRLKSVMTKYTNAIDDYSKIFAFARQYSGRNLNADLAIGDTWHQDLQEKYRELTNKVREAAKTYTDAVANGLNSQRAAAERQKLIAALNIAALAVGFAAIGITAFSNFAKFADKRYVWDAVSGGGSLVGASSLAIKTSADLKAAAGNALGASVIKGNAEITKAVNNLAETFRASERRIAMAAPSLQTREEFDNRRNPAPGFVDTPWDVSYIGYTEVQKRSREETGTFYWVERTYYRRWLL